jgi:hypothetical protein
MTTIAKSLTADPGSPHWMRYVAMLTGTLAAVAGYLTVRGTMLSNEAVFHSTKAVLYQAQASDSWAEYQADSIKARVTETAAETVSNAATVGQLARQSGDLRGQQPAARKKAEGFEGDRDATGHRPGIGGGIDQASNPLHRRRHLRLHRPGADGVRAGIPLPAQRVERFRSRGWPRTQFFHSRGRQPAEDAQSALHPAGLRPWLESDHTTRMPARIRYARRWRCSGVSSS